MARSKHAVYFSDTHRVLSDLLRLDMRHIFERAGAYGVDMLEAATPKDSGITAGRWTYEIEERADRYILHFCNDNENQGANIVILLQYGHALRQGGYIEGFDFLNPASKEIFIYLMDAIMDEVLRIWRV